MMRNVCLNVGKNILKACLNVITHTKMHGRKMKGIGSENGMSVKEIQNTLRSMKAAKVAGFDKVSVEMLKAGKHHVLDVL